MRMSTAPERATTAPVRLPGVRHSSTAAGRVSWVTASPGGYIHPLPPPASEGQADLEALPRMTAKRTSSQQAAAGLRRSVVTPAATGSRIPGFPGRWPFSRPGAWPPAPRWLPG